MAWLSHAICVFAVVSAPACFAALHVSVSYKSAHPRVGCGGMGDGCCFALGGNSTQGKGHVPFPKILCIGSQKSRPCFVTGLVPLSV